MKKTILSLCLLFLVSNLFALQLQTNPPLTFTKDKVDVSGSSSTVLLNAVQFGILINGTTVYLTASQLESLKTESTNYIKNFPTDYPDAKNIYSNTNSVLVTSGSVTLTNTNYPDSNVIYENSNAVIISSQPPVSITGTVTTVEISTGTYYYVNITSYTGTPSLTAPGIGQSWMVDVDGGNAEFNINSGNTIRVIDGQGKSSDFKSLITNPTINVTTLSSGATVSVFIDYKK